MIIVIQPFHYRENRIITMNLERASNIFKLGEFISGTIQCLGNYLKRMTINSTKFDIGQIFQ
jgi:hypothetical protein